MSLSAAALIIAVAFTHREFTPTATATPAAAGPPVYVTQWRTLLAIGVPIGNPDAEIKIVEFADFECPFCRHADSVFKAVRNKHPSLVGVYFVHFPLRMHRFARLAARSAECAYAQGQFAGMTMCCLKNRIRLASSRGLATRGTLESSTRWHLRSAWQATARFREFNRA
jgi:Thioredoxin